MDKDLFEDRRRALEEEYFQKESKELAKKLQARIAQEQLGAATGVSDQDLLQRMSELGFGPETVALLPVIPLLYVAWSNGEVTPEERAALLDVARRRGVAEGSEADARLAGYLRVRPDRRFFDTTLEMIRQMVAGQPDRAHDLMSLAHRIAEVSGGVLGIGKISADEKKALDRLAQMLEGSYRSAAAEVLKKL